MSYTCSGFPALSCTPFSFTNEHVVSVFTTEQPLRAYSESLPFLSSKSQKIDTSCALADQQLYVVHSKMEF